MAGPQLQRRLHFEYIRTSIVDTRDAALVANMVQIVSMMCGCTPRSPRRVARSCGCREVSTWSRRNEH